MLDYFAPYFMKSFIPEHFLQEKFLKLSPSGPAGLLFIVKPCMIDFISGIFENIFKCIAFINARRRRRT
eukprot:UN02318